MLLPEKVRETCCQKHPTTKTSDKPVNRASSPPLVLVTWVFKKGITKSNFVFVFLKVEYCCRRNYLCGFLFPMTNELILVFAILPFAG